MATGDLAKDYYAFVFRSLFKKDAQSLADQHPRLNALLNIYEDLFTSLTSSKEDDDKNLLDLMIDQILRNSEIYTKMKIIKGLKNELRLAEEKLNQERSNYESNLRFMKQHCGFRKEVESNVSFFESKFKEYRKMAQSHEEYLMNLGFHDQLTDEAILKLSKENDKIREEVQMLNQKLEMFEFNSNEHDLKMVISKMKEDLERYEDELEKALDESKENVQLSYLTKGMSVNRS